uniref:Putative secreted protein n=1 Tax=Anopheles marajoara TaxID=58244 RepID=A0A2M4CDW0_9DIPT
MPLFTIQRAKPLLCLVLGALCWSVGGRLICHRETPESPSRSRRETVNLQHNLRSCEIVCVCVCASFDYNAQ